MSLNIYTCSGNIGQDAELRTTSNSGTPVLNFSLAVNDRVRNSKTNEWEDYTNWVRFCMFGERAKKLAPYLKKGVKVAVTGRLRYSEYTSKDGSKRNSIEFIVNDIEFLTRRGNGDNSEPATENIPPSEPDTDEDLPF